MWHKVRLPQMWHKVRLPQMWHKVRLPQMSERERLPELKENSKLIKLKEEIIGRINEELLEENESNITDINNLIFAAATIMTLTMNQHSKRSNNKRNEIFWKIRRQLSNWMKELQIKAETGTGSDNGKLNREKRKINEKKATNAREDAQLTDTEAESAGKSPRNYKI